MSDEIAFEIVNGDEPSEIARRISSIVVGNRDTFEKNSHCWFFGENNEWAVLRITRTKFVLRSLDGITTEQNLALKTVIEWLVNDTHKTANGVGCGTEYPFGYAINNLNDLVDRELAFPLQ